MGERTDWSRRFYIPPQWEIDRINEENRQRIQRREKTHRSPYLAVQWNPGQNLRFTTIRCDVRADHTPKGTYLCTAQFGMDLTELQKHYPDAHHQMKGVGGYAGLQISERQSQAILSLWDVFYTDEYGVEQRIRPRLIRPQEQNDGFGGEGTGAHHIAPYPWYAGEWYQVLVFCYESPEEHYHTIVEMQISDPGKGGGWTHFASYDTGLTGSCFTGPVFSFLENYLTPYAGNVRTMEIRNVLLRSTDGEWFSPETVRVSASGAGTPKYHGSYAWGQEDDRLWMITSGAGEDQSGRNSGQKPEMIPLKTYI